MLHGVSGSRVFACLATRAMQGFHGTTSVPLETRKDPADSADHAPGTGHGTARELPPPAPTSPGLRGQIIPATCRRSVVRRHGEHEAPDG